MWAQVRSESDNQPIGRSFTFAPVSKQRVPVQRVQWPYQEQRDDKTHDKTYAGKAGGTIIAIKREYSKIS